jgi:hypothetical protein
MSPKWRDRLIYWALLAITLVLGFIFHLGKGVD